MSPDRADQSYRALLHAVPMGFCIIELLFDEGGRAIDYTFLEMNEAFVSQTGLHDAVGRTIREIAPGIEEAWFEIYGEIARTGVPRRFEQDSPALGRYYQVYAYRFGAPEDWQVAILFEDILPRRTAEEKLRQNEARFRFLNDLHKATAALSDADTVLATTTRMVGEHMGVSVCAYADMDEDQDGFTIRGDWSAAGSPSIVGHYSLAAFGRKAVSELGAGRPLIVNDNLAELEPHEAKTFRDIGIAATICMPLVKDGRLAALMAVHHKDPHVWKDDELALIREVTERSWAHVERVGAEASLRELNANLEARVEDRTARLVAAEEALRQSQKMEAVGQLTGGLAHDFNNLLMGIGGSLEMIKARLAQGRVDDLDRYFHAAQGAVKRAASVTHRLLAFSRRQTLDPKPTDPGRLVADMEELIRRTVGPEIAFEVHAPADIWPILVDPNQLENALLNLCINARDAMPEGGKVTIAIANRTLDNAAAGERDMAPGDYVTISVCDTGTGMTPEVRAKAFDPFFTTKPLGEGTGLGLSMIYGFVRQSGGQLRLHSEVGEGTTMRMFLPRHDGAALAEEGAEADGVPADGAGETILVIDDEPTIRMLIADLLTAAGYRVIEAGDGPSGLRALESAGRVDLLITDVGLPGGMNGRQIADAGRALRPDLGILFITGYAEAAVIRDGQLDPGMGLLTKPFDMDRLGARVREMLEG